MSAYKILAPGPDKSAAIEAEVIGSRKRLRQDRYTASHDRSEGGADMT